MGLMAMRAEPTTKRSGLAAFWPLNAELGSHPVGHLLEGERGRGPAASNPVSPGTPCPSSLRSVPLDGRLLPGIEIKKAKLLYVQRTIS